LAGCLVVENHETCGAKSRIKKRVGRHAFRHSYFSLLIANGGNVKVAQSLMRRAADSRVMFIRMRASEQRGKRNNGLSRWSYPKTFADAVPAITCGVAAGRQVVPHP
jgi:hypothetical protein